ncbi:MAG: LLM class flavin-dependent oxidoreductase [Chloroflexi bacterium]|nr:LLM class flavin-dependent oxidoreductase [Chloroflexota bacterium]
MTGHLDFSLGLWGMQSFKHAPRHHADLYREMLDDALWAEELGFSHFWLTEHHFWYDGYCPSLLVAAGAVAARTSRMRVGTSMLLLPMHDPLRVAQAAAVADIVAGGRFDLGVAVGYRHVEFDGFGVARGDRAARMEEALDVLHLAWTQDRFSYRGRFFQYEDVSLNPRPLQRPIPIWIGGWAEPVVRRAAGRGLNVMGAGGDALRLYEQLCQEAGRDPQAVAITSGGDVWVDEDEEGAKAEMGALLRYLYHEQLGGWGFFTNPVTGKPVFFNQPQILNNIVEAAVSQAMIGRPETIVAKLEQRLASNPLANHVFCRVRFDSVPQARLHRCMELLAKEVMPHFQKAPSPAGEVRP